MLDGLFSNKLFPHGTRLYYKQAPEAFYNKRVTSQSESNTTATYLLRCKKISVSKQGVSVT